MAKRDSGGGLSLRTKDASAGGGIDGAKAVVSEIGWVDEFTYGGRHKDKPQAALRVLLDIAGFEKPWEQHYSAGPSEKYEVVSDGDGIKSLGKAKGLNKNCSAYRFFEALEEAADAASIDIDDLLPELDGGGHSVRELEGKSVILGNVQFETVGGDKKDLPVIVGFSEDEEEDAPKGKAGKSKGGPSIEDQTGAIVKSLVDASSKPIKKSDLGNLVFQEDRKNPDIKAMMQLCFKDSFLSEIDGVEFDKKKGVLRAAD